MTFLPFWGIFSTHRVKCGFPMKINLAKHVFWTFTFYMTQYSCVCSSPQSNFLPEWNGDKWQVTNNRWQVTGDRWQVTPDMWHVTCYHDRWKVTSDRFFSSHFFLDQCYYLHTLRDSVFPICIFLIFLVFGFPCLNPPIILLDLPPSPKNIRMPKSKTIPNSSTV